MLNLRPMSYDELSVYPSIMAEQPAVKTSGRYSFIPTTRVIEQFEAMGFYPMKVQEARANEDHRGFQKHIVRFRQPGIDPIGVDQLFPEIVLVNSHDAGNAFSLMAGIYRLICLNGMVVGESFGGPLKINHVGYTDQAVREAVKMIGDRLPGVVDKVAEFKEIEMTPDDAGVFAYHALGVKYGQEALMTRDFDTEALLAPVRQVDTSPALWSAYNTVQEKLVERGARIERREMKRSYWNRENRAWEKSKIVAAKPANSPTENIRVNKGLWDLTEEFDKRIKEKGHFTPGIAAWMKEEFAKQRKEIKQRKADQLSNHPPYGLAQTPSMNISEWEMLHGKPVNTTGSSLNN